MFHVKQWDVEKLRKKIFRGGYKPFFCPLLGGWGGAAVSRETLTACNLAVYNYIT